MSRIKHVESIDYKPTFRTQKVCGMFDVSAEKKLKKEWDIEFLANEKEWKIGLIIGASGTGKTTLSKKIFGDENYHKGFEWGADSALDDFDENLNVKEIVSALSHVGFSSPPSWLLLYKVLSNGQKFRADIARTLLESQSETIVYDEFTSVVDRLVAQVGCVAVRKLITQKNKKFVAVTCHSDVEEWLQPDWVLDMSTGDFKWGFLQRPEINLEIFEVDKKAWKLFKENHYLTSSLSKSAKCFCAFLNGEPCAFSSAINFVHPRLKNCMREHRTVTLPDFQGIGLGVRLSDFVADYFKQKGKRFLSTTSHPAMCAYRVKSKKWITTRSASHAQTQSNYNKLRNTSSANRLSMSFEYVG